MVARYKHSTHTRILLITILGSYRIRKIAIDHCIDYKYVHCKPLSNKLVDAWILKDEMNAALGHDSAL